MVAHSHPYPPWREVEAEVLTSVIVKGKVGDLDDSFVGRVGVGVMGMGEGAESTWVGVGADRPLLLPQNYWKAVDLVVGDHLGPSFPA